MKQTFLLFRGLSILILICSNAALAQNSPSPSNGNNIIESAIDEAIMNDKNGDVAPPKSAQASEKPKLAPETAKVKAPVLPTEEAKKIAAEPPPFNPLPSDAVAQDNQPKQPQDKKTKKAEKEEKIKVKVISKNLPAKRVGKISKEEAEYLSSLDKKQQESKESSNSNTNSRKMKMTYEPAPSEAQEVKHEGFVIERDSSKIIKKRMSYTDSLTVKMCEIGGLSVVLDDDIQTELQTAVIDDKVFFDAAIFDNHRGAYVRLNVPIPDGKQRESALRLVRKDNDKAYLINLIGVPCPKNGTSPYPKEIYIKDKMAGISGKTSKIMTPEDTVIELSDGLPRKSEADGNHITIYDMVARSTSDWTIFGIQVMRTDGKGFNPSDFTIKMIDNLQVSQLPTKVDFLPVQSEKATNSLGVNTGRYKVIVNIDKQYMTENRYLYLMLENKKDGYYQYVRIDTLPYVMSLRKRGFDI